MSRFVEIDVGETEKGPYHYHRNKSRDRISNMLLRAGYSKEEIMKMSHENRILVTANTNAKVRGRQKLYVYEPETKKPEKMNRFKRILMED